MRKIPPYIILAAVALYFLAGCGIPDNAGAAVQSGKQVLDENKVTISILQLKVEIVDALEKMEYDYEKENNVKLNFITYGGGADYEYSLISRFQAGDAPDVYVNSGYSKLNMWLDKAEDLSDQPWVGDAEEGALEPVARDGKIYGMPQAYEGFGFAYNKTLFAKAGIEKLPDTPDTLEEACEKLKSAGIRPFSNSYAEWWVLGMHNFNLLLAHQPDPQKFIEDIAAGKTKIKDNPYAAGWVRLLNLTLKYGQDNPTVTGDYTASVNDFVAGRAAMIQQGNWIQPYLDKVDKNLDVGFMPMPISNTPDNGICAGVPNFWVVYSGSGHKAECKAWLNWMVASETGRRYVTDELKFISPFRSIKAQNYKGLNASLFEYLSNGRIYGWECSRLPDGATEEVGAAMMKYLGRESTEEELYNAIEKSIIERTKDTSKLGGVL
jgi:raffinose/stachyose/melibiose transport system substrate-binding protein